MQNIKNIEIPKVTKEAIEADFTQFEKELKAVASEKELIELYQKVLDYYYSFVTNFSISSYRNNGDLKNEAYKQEFNMYLLAYSSFDAFYKNLNIKIKSNPFFTNLKSKIGINCFKDIENARSISKEAIEIDEKINQLVIQYETKIGTAQIEWNGEKISLSHIQPFCEDPNREIRKKAYDAIGDYYLEEEESFTNILLDLINLRNAYARELGYKNFMEYSFDLYKRIDYGINELEAFQKNVVEHLVPLSNKIYNIRKKNLNLETLSYFDSINFLDGEAELKHKNISKNIALFKSTLGKFSESWLKILNEMDTAGSIDYEIRENKLFGGYCTYLYDLNIPLIFSGVSNNTLQDLNVLTHEMGHAIQQKISNDHTKFSFFAQDCVEIFSHSMEMAIYPYLDLFFEEENIKKYIYKNFSNQIFLLISCTMVDEFQNFIYRSEDLNGQILSEKFNDLKNKYQFLAHNNSEDNHLFYSTGKNWMLRSHIFCHPFYMIDYALAVIVAIQLYQQSLSDPQTYVQNFETLAKNIGNLSQKNISEYSSCFSAFEFDKFKELAQFIDTTLEQMQ